VQGRRKLGNADRQRVAFCGSKRGGQRRENAESQRPGAAAWLPPGQRLANNVNMLHETRPARLKAVFAGHIIHGWQGCISEYRALACSRERRNTEFVS